MEAGPATLLESSQQAPQKQGLWNPYATRTASYLGHRPLDQR
jgi:hypothetical protein